MILELLESRRARRFAGGALAASTAVHLVAMGVAAHRAPPRDPNAPEVISVRYLIPPNRPATAPEERIQWAALGPGTTGWAAGAEAADAALPKAGGDRVALATRDASADMAPEPAFDPGQVFQEFEVDSAAAHDPRSGGPTYPDALRSSGVQGHVLVEFAVDTTGHADSTTFTVVEATHPEFAQAVREALPRMLFTPAVTHGRRVRQLVRLPMKFQLVTETAARGTE
jgi:TonB family protein